MAKIISDTLQVTGATTLDAGVNVTGNIAVTAGAVVLGSGGINFNNAAGTMLSGGAGNAILTDGFLNYAPTSKTISGGVITATSTYTVVDTEAAGATDDLDTINGGAAGNTIIIRAANDARTVVIKDATGNIRCPSDRSLTHTDDIWTGIYNGTNWCEQSFADNTA